MLAMGISHWLTQFKALFKKIHGFLCSITCICLGFHTDCTVLCKSNANDNRRIKRYIERYIIRAIVLFLGKISFPASDISFPLCDISFQLHNILFLLWDISFWLKKISLKFIVTPLWNTHTLPQR